MSAFSFFFFFGAKIAVKTKNGTVAESIHDFRGASEINKINELIGLLTVLVICR